MKKTLLLSFALAVGFSGTAQTYSPVALTGFTADVVANGSGTVASSTSTDLDGASFALAAQNYINPSSLSPSSALPNSGTITSAVASTPGLTYQLAPYTGNNSLRIASTGTGTLTFATAQAADQVFVLATSGSGASTVTITVNFTDATSQVFTGQTVNDWFNASGYAIQGISRVSRATNMIENSTINPRLYQIMLTLSAANAGKSVQSIDFNKTSTGGVLNVMGISVRTVASALATDAGITAISTPTSGCALTSQETVTVMVKNFGSVAQSNIPVSYTLNNGTPVSENLSGPLAPNASVAYTFTTKANLGTIGSYSLEARTNLTGDLAPGNDALTKTVVHSAVPAASTVTASGPTTFCTNGSVSLMATSATTGATFQWFNNGVAIASANGPTYHATTAGSYTVTAELNGCSGPASAATTVTINNTPSTPGLTAGGATTFCTGGSVTLTATSSAAANATFTWFHDGNIISNANTATYAANATGIYTVIVTDNGCGSNASVPVNVTVNPLPAAPSITRNGFILTSSSTVGNQWHKDGNPIPGATNPTYITTSNGNYTAIVTANGCSSAASNAIAITNTGMKEAGNELAVSIYPNPSNGIFTLQLPEGKAFDLTVTDLTGKVILHKKATKEINQIDLQNAAKGIYLLKLVSEGQTLVRKLVKE